MKKVLLLVFMLIFLVGCGKNENELIMVTEAGFAPYEYYDNGEIVGVDVDIANEIAKEMGKKLVVKDVAFDSIINEVKTGKADFGAAGISYSDERAEEVDFSVNYSVSKQVVIVKENSAITSTKDIDNKKIAVQLGSIADTYVTEVMGPTEEIASSLADIFNGMVYDSTFLLIIISSILALILGQEFSKRTINLEVSAGHSRKQIFTSKIISYLIAFNLMSLVYPVSGCIREFGRFGVADVGMFFYNIIKAIIYSCLLNSAIFLIAILICCYLQDAVKATSVTAIIIFVLSLYLGYGMMLRLPVGFLPTYQIRIVVSMKTFFQPIAILVGCIWSGILVLLSWIKFCKCDFK